MNTKRHLMAMLLIFTVAAGVFGQNPKRSVVFTLNPNEDIVNDEYYLLQTFGQNRFACVVKNTVLNTYTFVFNGQRLKTVSTGDDENDDNFGYDPYDNFKIIDLAKDNGYIFTYMENGKCYINYRGVVSAGYEDITCANSENYNLGKGNFISSEKDYDYCYKLAGRWYAHKNGKNKRIDFVESYTENGKWYVNINGTESRYDNVYDLTLTESGKYAYSYQENGKEYVNINGTVSRGYDGVSYLTLTASGKYAYRYQENGKIYVNINGTESRGYDDVYNLTLTESGKYAYRYKENGKWYVNINGTESRGYDYVYNLTLTESGKYVYIYKENGKEYVNINGTESRGYDDVYNLTLTESGKYAYSYQENGKWYVNINGTLSRGYDDVYWDLTLTESGKYAYSYQENGKWYKNDNGNIKTKANNITENTVFNDNSMVLSNTDGWGWDLDFDSDNKQHSFYSSYKYEYVVIDGSPYGKAPAFSAGYNKNKNAFVWTAQEGREFVIYEYKLD